MQHLAFFLFFTESLRLKGTSQDDLVHFAIELSTDAVQCLGAIYTRIWNVHLEWSKKKRNFWSSSQGSSIDLEPVLIQARHHELSMTSCTDVI